MPEVYHVNIEFRSASEKDKFIKVFHTYKNRRRKDQWIDGHITTSTVEIQSVGHYRADTRETFFSAIVPLGGMDKILEEGEWTVTYKVLEDHSESSSLKGHFNVKKFTLKVSNPTWGMLWDAAEVLFRESGDFHRYFEGIDIDRQNRVIDLAMGS
jgi:hypothetical protein